MDIERMRKLAALVEEVFDLAPAERARRLAEVRRDDADLEAEVGAMLGDEYQSAADALALPAIAAATAALAEIDAPTRTGQRIGAWVLEDEIGHGGMGAVYRARRADGLYEAAAAIKFLRRGLAQPAITRRFLSERQILASLAHPGIARLLDGGTAEDGSPFIVMELIDGRPIDRFCDEENLDVPDRVRLFLEATDAVQHAHHALIIHRDLKPSNILVTPEGRPKLLDFGVAKLVGDSDDVETTGLGPLTPAFASPEQLRGLRPTVATDVYALGLVLYRLLTGRMAFKLEGASPAEIERRVTTEEPPRPSEAAREIRPAFSTQLVGDLDNILLMALRKEPERRYPSVEAFATDLRRSLEGLPVAARPATVRYRLGKFVGRHRAAVAGSTLAVLAIVGVSLFYARRVSGERDSARQQARRAEQVTAFLQNLFTGADPTRTRGDSLTLVEVVDEGRGRLDTALAGDPRVKRELLTTLGTVYRNLGRLDTADSIYHAALRLSDSLDGSDAPARAAIFGGLARVEFQRGNIARSSVDLDEALRIHERTGDSLGVADVLVQRLTLLINARKLDSARSVLDRVFAIDRRQPRVDSAQYAKLLADRAIVESFSGQHPAAIRDARSALDLWRRTLAPNDPRIASGLSNLGVAYENAGEYDSAATAYRQTVALTERIFGPDHPVTARRLATAGPELASIGFSAEGLAMTKRALAIRRRISGPDSLDVAHTNMQLGNVYQFLDSIEAALPYYRRSIAIYARSTASPPINLYFALYNLGVALNSLHRHREAAPYLRRALALATDGKLAVETALATMGLGESLAGMDSTAVAERLLRRSLAIIDSTEGPNHVDATYALEDLADLYTKDHRYQDAVSAYRRLIPLLEATRFKKQPAGLVPVLERYARALRAAHDTAGADSVTAYAQALR
jgi:tetratricopeptide (TPR) repeat protein/predicted Ser/Thr protein kinase